MKGELNSTQIIKKSKRIKQINMHLNIFPNSVQSPSIIRDSSPPTVTQAHLWDSLSVPRLDQGEPDLLSHLQPHVLYNFKKRNLKSDFLNSFNASLSMYLKIDHLNRHL